MGWPASPPGNKGRLSFSKSMPEDTLLKLARRWNIIDQVIFFGPSRGFHPGEIQGNLRTSAWARCPSHFPGAFPALEEPPQYGD
jgi:hypothetical protein